MGYGVEWMDRIDPTMEIFLPAAFALGLAAVFAVAYVISAVTAPYAESAIERWKRARS